jgi:hypothetical protein
MSLGVTRLVMLVIPSASTAAMITTLDGVYRGQFQALRERRIPQLENCIILPA